MAALINDRGGQRGPAMFNVRGGRGCFVGLLIMRDNMFCLVLLCESFRRQFFLRPAQARWQAEEEDGPGNRQNRRDAANQWERIIPEDSNLKTSIDICQVKND